MPTEPNPVDHVDLKLDEIQGNILAGFNNDHQRFLFLHINDPHKAKAWLKALIPKVSTTTQVKASNDKRKADIQAGKIPTNANWINIAFNHPGLKKLAAPHTGAFPTEFQDGMAKRSSHLGDVGMNAPDQWDPWFRDRDFLHIILLLSADDAGDLAKSLADATASLVGSGIKLIHTQSGENAPGLNGNEHFGFKDGVSQPGIKGFTLSTVLPQPANTGHQGLPGQDLLWPGEFVLGYPTQVKSRPTGDFDGPNPAKGPDSTSGPDWTKNGSYLVFRKLGQDVAGFRNSVRSNAAALAVDPEVLGAKIVGRFRSGCPMEQLKPPTVQVDTNNGDPSLNGHPEFTDDNHKVFFEYGDDPAGVFVPRSGHIRKAYPRDEQLLKPDGTADETQNVLHESDTQTHRILRRGIPFGVALPMAANGLAAEVTDDQISRGLLFLCYQSDLGRQFEFIQTKWINEHNFPEPGDGADPVMSQVKIAPLQCPFKGQGASTTFDLKHFVTTNGGEYFFQPSISALTMISS